MHISQCTIQVAVFLMMNAVSTTPVNFNSEKDTWLTLGTSNIWTQKPAPPIPQKDHLALTIAPPSQDGIEELTSSKETSMPSTWVLYKDNSVRDTSKETNIMKNQYLGLFGPENTSLNQENRAQMITGENSSHSVKFLEKKRPIQNMYDIDFRDLLSLEGQVTISPQKKIMRSNLAPGSEIYTKPINKFIQGRNILGINLAHAVQKYPTSKISSKIHHIVPQEHIQNHDEGILKDNNIVSNGQETFKHTKPLIENHLELEIVGQNAVQQDLIHKKIDSWFSELKKDILANHDTSNNTGIRRFQIEKALRMAKERLTVAFLGYLIENQKNLGNKDTSTILNEGWEFLKGYMDQWRKLDLEEVSLLRRQPNFCHFSPSFPAIEVFVNMIKIQRKRDLSKKLLQRLILKWKNETQN